MMTERPYRCSYFSNAYMRHCLLRILTFFTNISFRERKSMLYLEKGVKARRMWQLERIIHVLLK